MNRTDLIEAGAKAIEGRGYWDHEECAAAVIDSVEAMIRADERAQIADGLWTYIVPITDWIAGVNVERVFREEQH